MKIRRPTYLEDLEKEHRLLYLKLVIPDRDEFDSSSVKQPMEFSITNAHWFGYVFCYGCDNIVILGIFLIKVFLFERYWQVACCSDLVSAALISKDSCQRAFIIAVVYFQPLILKDIRIDKDSR